MEKNTDLAIPVEASLDGKRNAFHIICSVVGHSRPYAVCMHLCNERKVGRLNTGYQDCSTAIGKKECPALAMRKQEIEAGCALYFRERVRGDSLAPVTKLTVSIPAPARSTHKPVVSIPAPTDYSAAINRALERSKATPAAPINPSPPVAPIKVAPVQGESLLAMARRIKQQQQPQETK